MSANLFPRPKKKPSASPSVPSVAPVSTKGQSRPPVVAAQLAAAKTKKQPQPAVNWGVTNPGDTKKQQKVPKPQAAGGSRQHVQSQHRCKICGHCTHKANECPHKDASCFMCRKKGHIASVCRDLANQRQQQPQPQQIVQVHVHIHQNTTGVKK